MALWTLGVGRADDGVTRAQLGSFIFGWAFRHFVVRSNGIGGLRVCDHLTRSLGRFLGLALPEVYGGVVL